MVSSSRIGRRPDGPFALVGAGLGLATIGLGWDFYAHEIAGVAAELESIFAPPHMAIFAGVAVAVVAYLWALRRMVRPAHAGLAGS